MSETSVITTGSQQVARREEIEVQSMDQFIMRAATDPTFDVEKLERLMALQERREAQTRKELFDAAKARVQAKAPRIQKNGLIYYPAKGDKPATKIPYAKLEDVDASMRPIYTEEGFSVDWDAPRSDGRIRVVGRFSCCGHTEEREITYPPDSGGGKNDNQAVNGSVSYGRRTISIMFWNLITEGTDNDGVDVAALKPITQDQADTLRDKLAEVGGNQAMFLKYMKVESFEKITAGQLSRALQAIEDKRRK